MPRRQVVRSLPSWSLATLAAIAIGLVVVTESGSISAAPSSSPEATNAKARSPEATDAVVLQTAYRFDAEGLLSLSDGTLLPVANGSVTAQWYALNGWVALLLDGLDLGAAGPLCLGTSTIDPLSGLLTQATFAATAEGGCDDAGAGPVPLAGSDTGVRTCGDTVAFITRIPVETGGPLIANVLVFAGDGSGVGLTGRLDAPRLDRELDASLVDCDALPPPRVPVPATAVPAPVPVLTPAPHRPGSLPSERRAPAPSPVAAETCPDTDPTALVDVNRTAAGPYLMHHPATSEPGAPTIVFLPGGSGSYAGAQRVWETFFSSGRGFEQFRVVIPYALDGELIDQALRTFAIVDEVLWCHQGDPMRVHLAGSSNGGLAAFGLMGREPERFATLLGAPGAFPVQDPAKVDPGVWVDLLAGRAVFNAVGEFDVDWQQEVMATHNALTAAGIESFYVELPRQGHIPGSDFDSSILLDFWSSHP